MVKRSKLIVLRGPSGSGKSTIANIIFKKAKHKTVIISQDYYRFIFNPAGGSKPNLDTIHKMILHNTSVALNDGYDVILEGILSVRSYGKVLEELFRQHPKENYIFYLDVSLDETLKRHSTRSESLEFGEAKMREWYSAASRSGHKFEYVVSEQSSIAETVKFIKQTAGL